MQLQGMYLVLGRKLEIISQSMSIRHTDVAPAMYKPIKGIGVEDQLSLLEQEGLAILFPLKISLSFFGYTFNRMKGSSKRELICICK
ncbi:hypothetical protein Sjap_015826 [Stephania japonica]|uniref:Uncharacterized protein n=1 Tax=Stephania japonica TaxID=461633 RepID=A0AAP0IJV2_9MAGN